MGRVVTNNLRTRGVSHRLMKAGLRGPGAIAAAIIVLTAMALSAFVTPGHSQSGRRKGPVVKTSGNTTSTPKQPAKPQSSEATGKTSAQNPPPATAKADDEVDPNEIVRVGSHLVPVPATVLDSRGFAVTNLKLEDFELRVDGQVKPIAELHRTETPVRMVMLFDNSGSLSEAREFEKRAAMRFFRSEEH